MVVRTDPGDGYCEDADPGPVAALRELHSHLETGTPISALANELLIDALERWLDREEDTLDRAFCLTTRGGVPAVKADRLAQRNQLLRRAWASVPDWAEMRPYAAANLMSLSAERYITTRWPREMHDVTGPANEPALTWWRILVLDVPVPKARMIAKILSE